jgi:PhnB protein
VRFNAYLYFDGTCREAFEFYAAATGGRIGALMPYGGSPAEAMVGDAMKNKILHASLHLDDTTLMGSDMAEAPPPRGFAVTLTPGTVEEAERVFAALADGGTITMAIGPTFWAERFGMLVDRFGVPWMVNMDGPPPVA